MMRNKVPFFLSLVLILLLGLRCGSKEGCGDNELLGDWELIWYDEFESGIIDTSKWCYDIGGHGWGNNELQYYTDRPINSFIENGKLIIQAVKERYIKDGKEWQYTSARIKTMNRGDWKYGRIEVKAKLPYGQGIWPAIWMLPTEWKYGGWAASGEIDIMEMLGHETNKVYGTIHYGGQWPDNVHTGESFVLKDGDFSKEFHIFAIEWDTTYIKWFVDDSCYQVQTQWWSSGGPYPAPFDQKFHLIMNIAVGGNWPGYPDETTKFPQRMEVEYVRVYKKDNGR
ncbi:MAG: glycoside hydrolase family 16 protein [Candidatus Neomarinimicrobiota bacterium]|nr:MAG: glycoside hydrolase family 16 protein [Candidatus Neomarinimicrobiota bacterium]